MSLERERKRKGLERKTKRSKPAACIHPFILLRFTAGARRPHHDRRTFFFFFSFLCRALPPIKTMLSCTQSFAKAARGPGRTVKCGCGVARQELPAVNRALRPSGSHTTGPSDRIVEGCAAPPSLPPSLSVRRPSRYRSLCGDAVPAGCHTCGGPS